MSEKELNKLSIVIPVYNEEDFILKILKNVQEADTNNLNKEIIVVDDASTDSTANLLTSLKTSNNSSISLKGPNGTGYELETDSLSIYFNEVNKGKGASLRKGFKEATGDIIIVQDADLEYDPAEYTNLMQPILEDKADVVYGSRFLGGPQRVLYFWHYAGNNFLTLLSNMFTNLNLSDIETCYKMFKRDVLEEIELKQNRFGFEPEFTAKVAKKGFRVYEVPISYHGRTYEEGKKIGWQDGFEAIWCILRYNLF